MAVAEYQAGSPADILHPFLDANGSPYTGAPSAGGSMSLYGPASATVSVAGPTTVSDYGGGDYGIAATGAQLATAGMYRAVIPTITFSGRVFTNVTWAFTVGDIPPEYRTLRGIIRAVCEALDCGIVGTATGGSATTLVDTRWLDAGYSSNEFVDTEMLILEPGNGDTNPVRVSAYAPGTGTFTLAKAITAVTAGIDYLLILPGQRGLRYAKIKELIDEAIADLSLRQTVTDEVTLTTTQGYDRVTVPSTFLDVDRVQINRITGGTDEFWETVPPSFYEYWPDRNLLLLKRWFGYAYPLKVAGPVAVTPPTRLGQVVRVPWRAIVNQVVGQGMLAPAQQAGLRIQQARAAAYRLGTRG